MVGKKKKKYLNVTYYHYIKRRDFKYSNLAGIDIQ